MLFNPYHLEKVLNKTLFPVLQPLLLPFTKKDLNVPFRNIEGLLDCKFVCFVKMS